MAKLKYILDENTVLDWIQAVKANAYATYAHRGVKRKFSGDPYIKHPRRVANRMRKFGIKDPDVIAASLLHDVIEDTDVSYDDIKKHFNKRVADIVQWVTNPPKGEGSKTGHIKKIMKNGPKEAIIIKTFDRIDNLNDGGSQSFFDKYKLTTDIIRSGLKKRGYMDLYNEFMKTYNRVYGE